MWTLSNTTDICCAVLYTSVYMHELQRWSDALSEIAQQTAEKCDFKTGFNGSQSVGENTLSAPASVTSSYGDLVETQWFAEFQSYDYGSGGCSTICSHYTQVRPHAFIGHFSFIFFSFRRLPQTILPSSPFPSLPSLSLILLARHVIVRSAWLRCCLLQSCPSIVRCSHLQCALSRVQIWRLCEVSRYMLYTACIICRPIRPSLFSLARRICVTSFHVVWRSHTLAYTRRVWGNAYTGLVLMSNYCVLHFCNCLSVQC